MNQESTIWRGETYIPIETPEKRSINLTDYLLALEEFDLEELSNRSPNVNQEYKIQAVRRESDLVTGTFVVLNIDQIERSDTNPLIFITGANNGVHSVSSFTDVLAKGNPNRPIIVLGYPEPAAQGYVTQRFLDKVRQDDGVKPHADFFEGMCRYILECFGIEKNFDLMGFSAGAMIAAELLTRRFMEERTGKSVLLCPAGAKQQTPEEFKSGLSYDLTKTYCPIVRGGPEIEDLRKFTFLHDPKRDEQNRLGFAIWKELGSRAITNITDRSLSNQAQGNKPITIISGGDDRITKSSEPDAFAISKNRSNISFEVIPNELHSGPFIHPEIFADSVEKALAK